MCDDDDECFGSTRISVLFMLWRCVHELNRSNVLFNNETIRHSSSKDIIMEEERKFYCLL